MKTITVILPTIKQIEFKIHIHDEDIPVKGNAVVSGDDKFDKQVEDHITKRLDAGDSWAWCTVEVKGTYKCLTASEYLGACSYENEKSFKKDGYYDDMCKTVYNEIIKQIESL